MTTRTVTFELWENEPPAVMLGHQKWYRIDNRLSRRAAKTLAEEFLPLLERVCDGYSKVWNGHDEIGLLSEDAKSADSAIRNNLKHRHEQLSLQWPLNHER